MKKILLAISIIGFIVPTIHAQSREKNEMMFGFGAGITQSTKFGFGHEATFNIQKLDMYPTHDYLVQFRYTHFTPNLLYGHADSYRQYLDDPNTPSVNLEWSIVDEINEFGFTIGLPASDRYERKQIYWMFDLSAGNLRGTYIDSEEGTKIVKPETGYTVCIGTGPMFRVQLIENHLTLNGKLVGEVGALNLQQYSYGHWDTYFSARIAISAIWAF